MFAHFYGTLNSIIHLAIEKKEAIHITFYDLFKCFDTLSLKECCNDLYEAGIRDDRLVMIYKGSRKNRVAINTPVGKTDRVDINEIVTQGGPLGPIMCSVQIDEIGKEALERNEYLYNYKNVKIPPLAMMDDLATISKCGTESIESNAFINAKIEEKTLKLNQQKCHQLHISRQTNDQSKCQQIRVHDKIMLKAPKEKYLGDVISSDGRNIENMKGKVAAGTAAIATIMNILK